MRAEDKVRGRGNHANPGEAWRGARRAWAAAVRKLSRARLLVLTGVLAATVAVAAPAAASGGRPAATAVPTPVSLMITSVTPRTATPRQPVTVSGFITNTTAAPLTGLTVTLWSSSTPLGSRAGMAAYLAAASSSRVDQPVAPAVTTLAPLPAHATRQWSIKLKASDVGMTQFGVYPLAAQADQDGAPLLAGHARTFLPFYPPQPAHSPQQKLRIAWVWPLIDTPQQDACPGALLTGSLAGSLGPGGRLGGLLAAGAGPAGRNAQVTWAIDPALLAAVHTMTHPYRVGASATCAGGSARSASALAQSWLSQVQAATAQADFFVTPYADVDLAALSHQGLDSTGSELGDAFAYGRGVARRYLKGQSQRPAAGGSGASTSAALGMSTARPGAGAQLGWVAWPDSGIADYGVLGSLSANGVGTVLLDSTMMPPSPPVPFTPSGVTTTSTGVGPEMNVLLTDHSLDQVLAAAPTAAVPARGVAGGPPAVAAKAAAFATEQEFLAQTAMIVAEAPASARSVVIAPPRRWNPAAGVAGTLLTETATAPWLRPVSLAGLVTAKTSGQVPRRQPPQSLLTRQELRPSLLRQVRKLDVQIDLQSHILASHPRFYLSPAVAAVESSAWRGSRAGRRSAKALLHRVQLYLSAQQRALQIIPAPRVTLGGKSGSLPVTISNGLREPVRVRLMVSAPGNRIMISKPDTLITVPPGAKTIKIQVQSAVAGSATVAIHLASPGGTLLPGESAVITVTTTYFGTLAVVIIAIAFGVFVLTSIGRAVRRGGRGDGDAADPGTPDGSGEVTASTPNAASGPDGPDTVGAERQEYEPAPEGPDEHASARGLADPG